MTPCEEDAPMPARRREDGVMRTALYPRLTTENRMRFWKKIELLMRFGERFFEIDCAGCVYVEGAAWGMLQKLARHVHDCGGELRLVNVPPDLALSARAWNVENVVSEVQR